MRQSRGSQTEEEGAVNSDLTEVLVLFVGDAVLRDTGRVTLRSVLLSRTRRPGAVHMMLTGRDGVGSATYKCSKTSHNSQTVLLVLSFDYLFILIFDVVIILFYFFQM